MLKNPIHFFRKDGKKLSSELLNITFLPKSKYVIQSINEALAYRHLLLNQIIDSIPEPKKHSKLLKPRVFDDIYLDFRPESPNDTTRITVTMNSAFPPVISNWIERKTRHIFREKPLDIPYDLIVVPNSSVYFSSDAQIRESLELILKQNEDPAKHKFIPKVDSYYYVLKRSYEPNFEEFHRNFSRISVALEDENSLVFESIRNNRKDISKESVKLRKWCRENKIFGMFYRFISNNYLAILVHEKSLSLLQNYSLKSEREHNKK